MRRKVGTSIVLVLIVLGSLLGLPGAGPARVPGTLPAWWPASLPAVLPGLVPAAHAGAPGSGWAPDQADPGWQRFSAVMGLISEVFVDAPDLARVWHGAIRGAVEALGDRYTVYLEPRQYEQFRQQVLEGTFGGVGLVLDNIGRYVTVISTLPGTPAERAGLRPGDRIVRVDGEDVVGWVLEAVAQKIRGEPGTRVTLTIERGASSAQLQVELVRAEIKIQPIETRLLEGQVAYIRLSSFELGVGAELADLVAGYRAQGVTRYILDLRGNGGGLLEEAWRVANLFLPPGPLVQIVERGGKTVTIDTRGIAWEYSLAVLVDGGTASAAEIVAGAVRDRGYGILIGTRTFGKGSVQTVIPFADGAALKVTTARFLTPGGQAIDGKGIEPRILVEPSAQPGPAVEPFAWKRDLRTGMVGLDVLALQENLAFLGLYPGELDGVFGRGTLEGVRRFQASSGLPVTGAVDTATAGTLAEQVRQRLIESGGPDPVLEKALEVLGSASQSTQ